MRFLPEYGLSVTESGVVVGRNMINRKPWRAQNGYLRTSYRDADGRNRSVPVHTLVLLAYVGPRPSDRHQCNHKNGKRDDNRYTNLEWVTPLENMHHARDFGKLRRGGTVGGAKLSDDQAREIHRMYAAGFPTCTITARFGITRTSLNYLIKGKTWKHLGLEPIKRARVRPTAAQWRAANADPEYRFRAEEAQLSEQGKW